MDCEVTIHARRLFAKAIETRDGKGAVWIGDADDLPVSAKVTLHLPTLDAAEVYADCINLGRETLQQAAEMEATP